MTKDDILKKIAVALGKEGACKAAVFGSYARGDERPDSDVDVLVEFAERKSLLELVRMERELSDLTGKKVHLLTEKAISPYLRDSIKKEMEVLVG